MKSNQISPGGKVKRQDKLKERPWNNTGRWKLFINIQTRETQVIPNHSEELNFPGSQWDDVYYGSYRECLAEQMRIAKKQK